MLTENAKFRSRRQLLVLAGVLFLAGVLSSAAVAQPTFSKIFSPDTIGPDSVSMLIFTIDNTSGPVAADELAFTDDLPAGVTLAAPALVSNDCGGTLTAPDGGSTISLVDGMVGAGETCEIVVNVTAEAEDTSDTTYTNTSGALMSTLGDSGTATDDLMVDVDRPGFSKSFDPSTIEFGGRSTLTFTIDNSLNASFATLLIFSDTLPAGMVIADPSLAATDCDFFSTPILTAVPGTSFIGLTSGGVDDADTCTVTVDVIGGAIGSLGNVSGELLSTDSSVSSGKAAAVLDVTGFEDLLELAKEFTDDPVQPGGTTTLEFTVTNKSRTDSATAITFSDTIDPLGMLIGLAPSGPLPTDPCGDGSMPLSTLSFSSGDLTLTDGKLPPEASCTFSVELDVSGSSDPGTYPNTAGPVSGLVGGMPETGNTAGDLLFVVSFPVLTKEFTDDPVGAGGTVILEFTITNPEAGSTMSGITFEDIFDEVLVSSPSGAPAVDFCGTGSTATFTALSNPVGGETIPARLLIEGASLAEAGMPGASCTFSITLDVAPGAAAGTYANTTSEITGVLDDFPGTPTVIGPPASDDLVVVGGPQLSKEFTDDPAVPGGTVTLEFTLENLDDTNDASLIAFDDDLGATLAGLTLTSVVTDNCGGTPAGTGTDMFDYSGGFIAADASCTISLSLTLPAGPLPGAIFSNTTSVVTATVGGVVAESAAASDDLVASGLLFTKEFTDDPVIAGGTATLEFTLDNTSGTVEATGISFTDDLAAALTDLTATGLPLGDLCGPANGTLIGTVGDTFLTFSGGSVTAGSSCTFSVTITVPATIPDPPGPDIPTPDDTYANATSALIATIGSLVSLPPATDTLTVESTLLELTKEFTDDPVAPGDPVTLEFNLTNLHPSETASAIAFDDDLGAALAGLTVASELANTCGGTGIGTAVFDYSGGTLIGGASCTITLSLTVPGAPLSGSVFTNTTSGVTGTIATLPVTGDPASDDLIAQLLTLTKAFDGPTTATGSAVLTFTIENLDSSSGISSLAFSDDLDAVISGLEAISFPTDPCGPGSVVAGTSFPALTGASLDPGETCTFEVTVDVPATASPGSFLNSTSDLSQFGLPVAVAATAFLEVEPPPTFTKDFAPNPVDVGVASTLTFTIDNTASALAATGLDFTDTFPAGLVVATPPGAPTTCTGGTLTASSGAGAVSYSGGSVAAGATCVVVVDVTSSTAGAFINTTGDLTSSSGNSGPASDTLTVEAVVAPPVVTGASIGECEEVRSLVDEIEVTFSEDMFNPAGNGGPVDVTNPDSWRLVADGGDKDITTTTCGPLSDDDTLVAITSVSYDSASSTATLMLAGPLANGPYNLLACTDGLHDVDDDFGVDGDENGVEGPDHVLYFRVERGNRFRNGNFDCSLVDWKGETTGASSVDHDLALDRNDAGISGSAHLINDTGSPEIGISQCVSVGSEERFDFSGFFFLDTAAATVDFFRTCESFSKAGCKGASLGLTGYRGRVSVDGKQLKFSGPMSMETGAKSALCMVTVARAGAATFGAFVDVLRLLPI